MFDIRNTTKAKTPSLPFEKVLKRVLGKNYELSLVFCGDKLSKKLNKKFRKKDAVANILSFPLDKKIGEIFINIRRSNREAPKFNHSKKEHLLYLFIHGILHLSGHKHGKKMEAKEKTLLTKFN